LAAPGVAAKPSLNSVRLSHQLSLSSLAMASGVCEPSKLRDAESIGLA
jgi:hypothetical protein